MNLLRKYSLHSLRSRHNPIGRTVRFMSLSVILLAVITALWEAESIREIGKQDKEMIAELTLFVEGKTRMVEQSGKYAVVYEVTKTTFEIEEREEKK